jgi:hypothetical protein
MQPTGEVEDYFVEVRREVPLDYGDAPDSYGTLWESDGACHLLLEGYHLGSAFDYEGNGHPSPGATGDDATETDDEDGIVFAPPAEIGGLPRLVLEEDLSATITVIANVDDYYAYFDAWVDWDGNGSFLDGGEHVIQGIELDHGEQEISFHAPDWIAQTDDPPSQVFCRFRLDNKGISEPIGLGSYGEVEDYLVAVELSSCPICACIELLGKGSRNEYIRDGDYHAVYNYYRTRRLDFLEDEVNIYKGSYEVPAKYRLCGKDLDRHLNGLSRDERRELAELFWQYFTGELR